MAEYLKTKRSRAGKLGAARARQTVTHEMRVEYGKAGALARWSRTNRELVPIDAGDISGTLSIQRDGLETDDRPAADETEGRPE